MTEEPIPVLPGQADALALLCPGPLVSPAIGLWMPCAPDCVPCQETRPCPPT
jgi:hypothetical protein